MRVPDPAPYSYGTLLKTVDNTDSLSSPTTGQGVEDHFLVSAKPLLEQGSNPPLDTRYSTSYSDSWAGRDHMTWNPILYLALYLQVEFFDSRGSSEASCQLIHSEADSGQAEAP